MRSSPLQIPKLSSHQVVNYSPTLPQVAFGGSVSEHLPGVSVLPDTTCETCGRVSSYMVFKYSRISSAAVAPSPAAEATCLVLPARTSPAAKMPGTLVSRK